MGGSSGPSATTTTVNQSNIPDWLAPQVQGVIGMGAQSLFNMSAPSGTGTQDITGIKPFQMFGAPTSQYQVNPNLTSAVNGIQTVQGLQNQLANYQPGTNGQIGLDANGNFTNDFNQVKSLVSRQDYQNQLNQRLSDAQSKLASVDSSYKPGGNLPDYTAQQQQALYNQAMAAGQAETAGFSDLQNQGFSGIQNLKLPQQFTTAAQDLNQSIAGVTGTAGQAQGYGASGAGYGNTGAQAGIQGGALYGGMGADYGQQAAAQAGQAETYGANAARLGTAGGAQAQNVAATQEQLANTFGANAARLGTAGGATAQNLAGNLAQQAQQNAAYTGDLGKYAILAGQQAGGMGKEALAQAGQGFNAQQNYLQQATDPNAVNALMNPYIQNVLDAQNAAVQRSADINAQQLASNAARAGAFGGSRQAIEQAENQRNAETLKNTNAANAYSQAFQNAQANQQFGANLGLQGLGAGNQLVQTGMQGQLDKIQGLNAAVNAQQAAQSGLNTAIQAGNLGLAGTSQQVQAKLAGLQGVQAATQAGQLGLAGTNTQIQAKLAGLQGLNTANELYQTGIQGANTGLQGVDRQLAGTAQGMQGAQIGLQGVNAQQQAYNSAAQQAMDLANVGQMKLAGNAAIANAQLQAGGLQQAQQQQILNNAITNFATAQGYPMSQLNQYNALIRGYAAPTTTSTSYQAAPNTLSQLGGLGATAVGAYGALSSHKKGGAIKKPLPQGLHTIALRQLEKGVR